MLELTAWKEFFSQLGNVSKYWKLGGFQYSTSKILYTLGEEYILMKEQFYIEISPFCLVKAEPFYYVSLPVLYCLGISHAVKHSKLSLLNCINISEEKNN